MVHVKMAARKKQTMTSLGDPLLKMLGLEIGLPTLCGTGRQAWCVGCVGCVVSQSC